MNDWLIHWVAAVAMVLAGLAIFRKGLVGSWRPGTAWLPPELVGARLLYVEHLFRSVVSESWELSARVDRAYQSISGQLILIELKTRSLDQTFLSDVVELSAQRYAIETSVGERVSERAFVLVKSNRYPDGRFHKVSLMSHASVKALVSRRDHLLAEVADPALSRKPGMCRRCSFRHICPNAHR